MSYPIESSTRSCTSNDILSKIKHAQDIHSDNLVQHKKMHEKLNANKKEYIEYVLSYINDNYADILMKYFKKIISPCETKKVIYHEFEDESSYYPEKDMIYILEDPKHNTYHRYITSFIGDDYVYNINSIVGEWIDNIHSNKLQLVKELQDPSYKLAIITAIYLYNFYNASYSEYFEVIKTMCEEFGWECVIKYASITITRPNTMDNIKMELESLNVKKAKLEKIIANEFL